jgi:hypothetical protein
MLSASHKDTFSGVGWRSRRTRPARLTQEAEGCDYGRVVVSQSKPRVPGFFFWREPTYYVRYWPKADMPLASPNSRFGGKVYIAIDAQNVRL